ncbi:ABC transporter permease, partial [Streptosporangium vulgare]|uniref:ABC transporter permease n=1 Tax=Streptosporangium vulgare TaxID=46190 RepID=UPI0031D8BF48
DLSVYYGSGMAALFAFFVVGTSVRSLLTERNLGTLNRMRAAPIRPWIPIVGKGVVGFLLALVSVCAVWASSVLLFGSTWGDPLAVFALWTAHVLAAAAITMLVASRAKTDSQADGLIMGVSFVFAFLGGSLVPMYNLPDFLQKVALFTPNGWTSTGLTELAGGGGGLATVAGPIAALCGMALAAGGVAAFASGEDYSVDFLPTAEAGRFQPSRDGFPASPATARPACAVWVLRRLHRRFTSPPARRRGCCQSCGRLGYRRRCAHVTCPRGSVLCFLHRAEARGLHAEKSQMSPSPVRALVAANLRRHSRDKVGLFFMVVMPFVTILFVGMALGGSATGQDRIPIGVVARDSDPVATGRTAPAGGQPRPRDRADGRRGAGAVRRADRRLAAGLLIPPGSTDLETGHDPDQRQRHGGTRHDRCRGRQGGRGARSRAGGRGGGRVPGRGRGSGSARPRRSRPRWR